MPSQASQIVPAAHARHGRLQSIRFICIYCWWRCRGNRDVDRATALGALAVTRQAIEVVVATHASHGIGDRRATAGRACASAAGGERSFTMPALDEQDYAGAEEQQNNEN